MITVVIKQPYLLCRSDLLATSLAIILGGHLVPLPTSLLLDHTRVLQQEIPIYINFKILILY